MPQDFLCSCNVIIGTSPLGEAHRLANIFIFTLAPPSGTFKK